MLTILDHLPAGLLDACAADLGGVLSGPTLIHLPGAQRRPLFISTLLHGNETTGWEALRELLGRYQGRCLPRPLSIFIGNVQAAKEHLRHLDEQPDFNRIWSLGQGLERAMALRVLDDVRMLRPVACLDIHNTSGNNPMYACVHRLDDDSLKLARAFSSMSVYVTQPESLLGVACSKLAPALTLECGKPGRRDVELRVSDFLENCLALETPAELAAGGVDSQLLRPVATVRVPEEISFSFEDQQPSADVDLCFRADLDGHNFSTLPHGTAIARIRAGSGAHLQVLDAEGKDVSARYFRTENGALVTVSDLIPTLLTHNSRIIRQDCLCYLMEPMAGVLE